MDVLALVTYAWVSFRCTHRAGFGSGGSSTVPGQGYNDIALLSSPVDHHLVMRVVQVGLQDKNMVEVQTQLREKTSRHRTSSDKCHMKLGQTNTIKKFLLNNVLN